jgi:hypothetical protein
MKNRYGTRAATGHTCHVGLTNRRTAFRLARAWSKEFPAYAPYVVTCNGVVIS